MPLLDPQMPKSHRIFVSSLFVALLLAVLALGAMSIARSVAGFGRTIEEAQEFRSRAGEEIDTRFEEGSLNDIYVETQETTQTP